MQDGHMFKCSSASCFKQRLWCEKCHEQVPTIWS